jgi:hypothetical protein
MIKYYYLIIYGFAYIFTYFMIYVILLNIKKNLNNLIWLRELKKFKTNMRINKSKFQDLKFNQVPINKINLVIV